MGALATFRQARNCDLADLAFSDFYEWQRVGPIKILRSISMKILPKIILIIFAVAAHADERQHGNLIFSIPEGWQLGRNSAGVQVLLPKATNDTCDTCRLHLTRGASGKGRMEAFLTESMTMVLDADDQQRLQTLDIPGGEGSVGGTGRIIPHGVLVLASISEQSSICRSGVTLFCFPHET